MINSGFLLIFITQQQKIFMKINNTFQTRHTSWIPAFAGMIAERLLNCPYYIRNLCLLILLLPMIALAGGGNKFSARVAVVDIESILEHSTAIAHIKKTINLISDKIEKELSEKEVQLKKSESELIEQRGLLTAAEYEKEVFEFNKKVSTTQQEARKKKNALERAHAEAYAEVHNNTILIMSELSKKYGFNIVFPSAQVLFVENDLNITLEVISSLNERLKEVEVKYNP